MFYVLFVGSGHEQAAETYIRKNIPEDLYQNCFCPKRKMKKKIHGKWVSFTEKLIPGYLFIESNTIGELYLELSKSSLFLKVLGKAEQFQSDEIYPLNPSEERWLKKISGIPLYSEQSEQSPVAELSQVGFNENDEVIILSGPLMAMKGQVKKINLHKRIAEVEVDFMGGKTSLYLGIELVEKAQNAE